MHEFLDLCHIERKENWQRLQVKILVTMKLQGMWNPNVDFLSFLSLKIEEKKEASPGLVVRCLDLRPLESHSGDGFFGKKRGLLGGSWF